MPENLCVLCASVSQADLSGFENLTGLFIISIQLKKDNHIPKHLNLVKWNIFCDSSN